MAKGRIGLSLSEDVLAILNEFGRKDWREVKTTEEMAVNDKRPTRTEMIERGVRLTGEMDSETLGIVARGATHCGMTQAEWLSHVICGSRPQDYARSNGGAVERTTIQPDAQSVLRAAAQERLDNEYHDVPRSERDSNSLSPEAVQAENTSIREYGERIAAREQEAEGVGEQNRKRTQAVLAERKAARKERKAKLQENVKAGGLISDRGKGVLDAVGPSVESGRGKASVETFTRPLGTEQPGKIDITPFLDSLPGSKACYHPAQSRTTGKNWKCTACGHQHE